MAKAPVAGAVKTRLIPALGAEGAALLARQMLAATVATAKDAGLGVPELCVSPDSGDVAWNGLMPDGVVVTDQVDGDLGERMSAAAKRVIGGGNPVLLIGTDCPDLTVTRIHDMARRLADHDAVIHPAADGGYVLLGLRRFDPWLFADIKWSGADVAEVTCSRILALGWSLHAGKMLRDIDEPGDLSALGAFV
ncbi:MAG: TIGR04282 family arsenosugar biosynthesis glycosyltransferase [Sphingomonas sp.]|nr:TIGR04282 family arsenosugar biosynthesis glycosyltransferase [Sphingomonas sp.]